MSHKSKGINAERELVHLFWNNDWAAIRVAGSGNSQWPSPDVLAGNGRRKLALECKASRDHTKYLTAEEVEQLRVFSTKFGAEPWIGVRFDKMEWFFLSLDDLKKSGANFSVSVKLAELKGLKFNDLIQK